MDYRLLSPSDIRIVTGFIPAADAVSSGVIELFILSSKAPKGDSVKDTAEKMDIGGSMRA